MTRPADWNELDDAYLEIFGTHPDLVGEPDVLAVTEGPGPFSNCAFAPRFQP